MIITFSPDEHKLSIFRLPKDLDPTDQLFVVYQWKDALHEEDLPEHGYLFDGQGTAKYPLDL